MASRGNEETYGTQVVEAADASIGLNITGGVVFGRPLGQAIATGNPSVCLSVCNVGVLWPNGLSDRDDFWHTPCPGQQ